MTSLPLLYKGSVKDIYQDADKLFFKYSNRYSVFDWGEMPDEIPQKGQALATMAGLFFEYLSQQGISSHFLGSAGGDGIYVHPVEVRRPHWQHKVQNGIYDYSMYAGHPTQCLVPLEVIFRRYLGQGNSLERRLQKNPSYLQDLELTIIPDANSEFSPALVEFSTKLESTDRYLTKTEIANLNIVTDAELRSLRELTQKIAQHLETLFASFGVKLWDGKFEFAFAKKEAHGERSFMLVDSIGPDELRLTYEGAPLSKEFLRQIYAPTSWYEAVGRAKDEAQKRGTNNWKEICLSEYRESPPALTTEQIEIASLLYKSLANEVAWAMKRKAPFETTATLKSWRQKCESLS